MLTLPLALCAQQSTSDRLTQAQHPAAAILAEVGYGNVRVVATDTALIVGYENTRYRSHLYGLAQVVGRVLPLTTPHQHLLVQPSQQGLVSFVVKVLAHDRRFASVDGCQVAVQLSPPRLADVALLAHAPPLNPTRFRIDVAVHPVFRVRLGDYDHPVATQESLAPKVTTSLWRGMRVALQWRWPLHNALGPSEKHARPRLLTLRQWGRLPGGLLASAAIGYFSEKRYGADVGLQKHWKAGRWQVGANVGLTGPYAYARARWHHGAARRITSLVTGSYWVAPYRLRLRLHYGVFLRGDRGWRAEVLRRFGEVTLGFFAQQTSTSQNAGFALRLPLPQRKYPGPAPVRVRLARTFAWAYLYRWADSGQRYPDPHDLEALFEPFEAALAQRRLVLQWCSE